MIMNMLSLQYIFEKAIRDNHEYVGIKLLIGDCYEIIINSNEDFKEKLEYYKRTYNDNLTLKTFKNIRITAMTYGTLEDVKTGLKLL